jgi:hypothetical protein
VVLGGRPAQMCSLALLMQYLNPYHVAFSNFDEKAPHVE